MASASNISTGERDTIPFDTVEFTAFLVEAKQSAGPVAETDAARSILPGAIHLRYSRGLYMYNNIYCGLERFSGHETVHFKNKAIWGMGYSGGLVDHYMWDLRPEWIYAVLRSALAQVSEELPFRGPLKYEYYGFEYSNHPLGHLGEFLGEETIKYREALVYHLWYVGGYIK